MKSYHVHYILVNIINICQLGTFFAVPEGLHALRFGPALGAGFGLLLGAAFAISDLSSKYLLDTTLTDSVLNRQKNVREQYELRKKEMEEKEMKEQQQKQIEEKKDDTI